MEMIDCKENKNMPINDFANCVYCGKSMLGNAYCPNCWNEPGFPHWNPTPNFSNIKLSFGTTEQKMRKYLPTLSDLLDRLTIVQQKELKIPQNREEYTQELSDLMHDIKLCLQEVNVDATTLTQILRDVIVLTLMNCEIWHNESNFRKGIKDGNNLELTHGLNGIRNTAKNKIQEKFGGRKDYKIDNVKAFEQWIPSGYEKKEEEDK